METANGQHEDLALKAAVQRVWGAELAPVALRERLHEVLSHDVVLRLFPVTRWEKWQSRTYGLAAAAVLLLGVGLLALEARGVLEARPRPAAVASAPTMLSSSLSRAHDRCVKGEVSHPFASTDLPAAIRQKLGADAGVAAPDPEIGQGWQLKSAGFCRVGGQVAAQMFYTRGGQSISVFAISLRSGRIPVEGESYIDIVNGRPMAGTVVGNAMYCVVGGGGSERVSLQDVQAVRNRVLQGAASQVH